MEEYSRAFRNLTKLSFSGLGVAVCGTVTFGVALVNYLACQFSFEMLGYEKKPLFTDELIGVFFAGALSEATINHCFSFMITAVLTILLFLTFQVVGNIQKHLQDAIYFKATGDTESAKTTAFLILRELIPLVIILPFLILAIRWDLELFRWRSILGALQIESTDRAVELLSFENQLKENGQLWVWFITRIGGWGYLSITALSCLGLEISLQKMGENFTAFMNSVGMLFNRREESGQTDAFYGYDQDGQPVYDPDFPLAYDVNGQPIDQEPSASEAANGYHAETGSHQDASASEATQEPLWGASGAQDEHRDDSAQADDSRDAILYDVIGGQDGEKVDLNTARNNPERYWVEEDGENVKIWDAEYRRELFREDKQEKAA